MNLNEKSGFGVSETLRFHSVYHSWEWNCFTNVMNATDPTNYPFKS